MNAPASGSTHSRFATQSIAEAIADEAQIDWTPAERALGPDAPALANLHLIEDVARAFRESAAPAAAPTRAPGLFEWGTLRVLELLGEGMTGEVYRAFDPALQREVALKLRAQRDPASDPGNHQLLAEARQLARIRQRNVLAVYGAAVHDGRAGIWSELIDGRTLAEVIADTGPLGPDEAIGIGLDLCRALGAVHAAGLVHGDVKAENVMRERGGRIVLMDFGASGNAGDDPLLLAGTRHYLPPEVLDGRVGRSADSDVHAVGVLLYVLLSGRFPRENGASNTQPLAAQRADLPDALNDVIARAIADDPAQRPASTAALARQLLALRPGAGAGADADADADANANVNAAVRHATPRRGRATVGLAAVALIAAASILWWMRTPQPLAPAWSVQAQLLDTASGSTLADGATVRLGDTLALDLTVSRPAHVYVFNEDSDGDLTVLFPAAGLDAGNPLPPRAQRLPGTLSGRDVAWQVSSPSADETFVLVVSEGPSPVLDERLLALTPVEPPETGTAQVTRGTGRLRLGAAARPALAGLQLADLVAAVETDPRHTGRLHVQAWRLRHAPP